MKPNKAAHRTISEVRNRRAGEEIATKVALPNTAFSTAHGLAPGSVLLCERGDSEPIEPFAGSAMLS